VPAKLTAKAAKRPVKAAASKAPVKALAKTAVTKSAALPPAGLASSALPAPPPQTLEERLEHLPVLLEHIEGCVEFMCDVARLTGTSREEKERAVAAFYDRLKSAEQDLSRIQDIIRLS
jgi:hypothetical protein